jgi:hypothetical protein
MASNRAELRAIRNMIAEAELILQTTVLPEDRAQRNSATLFELSAQAP